MRVVITKSFLTALIAVFLFSCDNTNKKDYNYQPEWREPLKSDINEISRILVKNNIVGCGEYFVKDRLNDPSEHLVACTSDGVSFNYYIVFTNTEKVLNVNGDGIIPPNP